MDEQEFHETRLLSENSRDCVEKSMQLRSVFLSVTPIEVPTVEGHTHGKSAANRSSASLMIDQLGNLSGRPVVFHQGSAADNRKGRLYTRTWHWAKDQNVLPNSVRKTREDIVAMVDVDYYIDMPKFLTRNFQPVVMYTFQPGSVAKATGEYKYTFNAAGEVEYTVSGGGHYVHKVWNYAGDSVAIAHKFLGFTVKYSTYAVERKTLDPDHQLVLLTPLRRYGFWRARDARKRLACNELSRLDVVERGEFTRMMVNSSNNITVHTGKVGGYLAASVLASTDDAIASAAITSKVKITLATVKSKMAAETADAKPLGAEILLEYHLSGSSKPTMINALDAHVRTFQWCAKRADYDPDAKPSMVAFMSPLVDGAFCPDDTKGNDKRMVDKRVTVLANEVTITPFLKEVVDEFVTRFSHGNEHHLYPVELDVVYEKQARPTQRHILHAADHELPDRKAKMFMKREAYQKVNDPRGITTINGCDKRDYSQFTYALGEVLKTMPWYAFGKKPRAIASRVAHICEQAQWYVDSTDFSRMDGRVNNFARYLERVLMLSIFNPRYHVQLMELMRSQHSLRGRTRNGVDYHTGMSRLSGSPETSAFNTILSAFVAFLAARSTHVDGRFMDADEAWSSLGMYGGDDGLTADIPRSSQEKAARMVGQLLKLDRTSRGERGVIFLSRHYGPDVWFGSNITCCDILRTLSKFHVTVHLPSNITPLDKLFEKSFALALTDTNTPIVGPFVQRVLKQFPNRDYSNVLGIWNSDLCLGDQYPNTYEEWMDDLVSQQVPEFDHAAFKAWLHSATGDQILHPPTCVPRVEVACIVGELVESGDFVGTTEVAPPQPEPAQRKFSRPRKKKASRSERADSRKAGSRKGMRPPARSPDVKGKK